MKKSKVTRIIVYASTFVIGTTGLTYTLLKKRLKDYDNYINSLDNIESDNFLVSAHRGFSSLEVENTKEAILLARDKNYVDYIEIDVRLTKDGKLILSHDNDLIVDGKHVRISNLTYEEATNLSFKYRESNEPNYIFNDPENSLIINRNNKLSNRDYHLIGLDEALELIGNKNILLDIKFDGNRVVLCNELINYFRSKDTNNIIFQSLDIEGIRYLKNHSNFNCQVLISNKEDLKYIDEFDRIGLNYYLFDEEIYKELSLKNKKIALWTINNTEDLERIIEIAGDNYKDILYITNYPDIIVSKLREKEEVTSK